METLLDYIAASTNALNGGLLAQWPDALVDPVYLTLVVIFCLVSLFVAFGFGSSVRRAAIWWAWEEPMPRVPAHLLKGLPGRLTLKEKMQPDWEPED